LENRVAAESARAISVGMPGKADAVEGIAGRPGTVGVGGGVHGEISFFLREIDKGVALRRGRNDAAEIHHAADDGDVEGVKSRDKGIGLGRCRGIASALSYAEGGKGEGSGEL